MISPPATKQSIKDYLPSLYKIVLSNFSTKQRVPKRRKSDKLSGSASPSQCTTYLHSTHHTLSVYQIGALVYVTSQTTASAFGCFHFFLERSTLADWRRWDWMQLDKGTEGFLCKCEVGWLLCVGCRSDGQKRWMTAHHHHPLCFF